MSKSLLIVICDFLLLSLLSIANFDKPKQTNAQRRESDAALKSENFVQTQMLETLKTALDAEQRRHEDLSRDVEKMSQVAEANRVQAQTHKQTIAQRERQLEQIRAAKEELERERLAVLQKSKILEEKVRSADTRNETLSREISAAAQKLEKSAQDRARLEAELGRTKLSDAAAQTKLRLAQEELRQTRENLARLQGESEKLRLENRAIEAEKLALSTRLEVASTKTQIYAENLKKAQLAISLEKAEKDKIMEHARSLSDNFSALADNQQALSKNLSASVESLRPMTASEVFAKIRGDFVEISFRFSESGILGRNNSVAKISALPFADGGKVRLFFHADSTPLNFSKNAVQPEKLELTVSAGGKIFTADTLYRVSGGGRLLCVELPAGFVEAKNVLNVAKEADIYKFTDCIVVNPVSKYYGQTPFMANFTKRDYAKLDTGLLESIFKKFSPSSNDAVLTRTGEALGVLVSGSDLFLVRGAKFYRALKLGAAYSPADAAAFAK